MPPKVQKKSKEEVALEKAEKDRLKELIIIKVEQHPCLFDRTADNYKFRDMKVDAWATVAKEVKLPVLEVKRKWKSLRDSYTEEKRMLELDSRSGSGASKRTPFAFYEQMKFMDQYVRHRKSISTADDEDSQDPGDDQDQDQDTQDEGDSQHAEPALQVLPEFQEALQDFDPTKTPDKQVAEAARQLLQESEGDNDVSVKTVRRSPRKTPQKTTPRREDLETPAKKKLKAAPMSQPLASLPLLSPEDEKRGMHGKRSKAKKDADLNTELMRVVGAIDSQLKSTSMDSSINQSSEHLLGAEIGNVLASMQNPAMRLRWKKKCRELLNDMEDDILLAQSSS